MPETKDRKKQQERKDKRTSAVMTALVMLFFLFFLGYPFFTLEKQEDRVSGIQIALGTWGEESSGEETGEQPASEESPEAEDQSEDLPEEDAEQSEQAPAPTETRDEPQKPDDTAIPTPEEVQESPADDTPQASPEKPDEKPDPEAEKKAKEAAEAEAKRKAEEARKKAEAEAKRKAEEEARRKQKELEEKKKQFSDMFGGGEGEDNTTAGVEEGDPQSSNQNNAVSSGAGDVGGGLADRKVLKPGKIQNDSQATGKVVVQICVDDSGKVISAKFTQKGSTSSDPGLIRAAERAAKDYTFSSSQLDKQCGTITFNFTLQ